MEILAAASVCLDTPVLVDNLRGKKQIVQFIKRLEDAGTTHSTSAVTCFELYYGAYGRRSETRTWRQQKFFYRDSSFWTYFLVLTNFLRSTLGVGIVTALNIMMLR